LPQRVYELGTIVLNSHNHTNCAWACAEVDGGFATAKGFAQALLRDLGADLSDVEWLPTDSGVGPWITGRGAKVMVNEEEVGQIGEIDPAVSLEFGLKVPIHAGEFNLETLGRIIPDPVL
jgi:phenylalanyl-tRNA synthetase beta chain